MLMQAETFCSSTKAQKTKQLTNRHIAMILLIDVSESDKRRKTQAQAMTW